MRMHKYNDTGKFTICCPHRITKSRNIIIDGILDNKSKGMYIHPLIVPDHLSNHHYTSIYISSTFSLQHDEAFASDVNTAIDIITDT